MKRFILLVVIFIASVVEAAPTQTINYNFWKPSDGDQQYGELIRDNWDKADTQFKINSNSITDHMNDILGAHAASAIATSIGPNVCQTSVDVQNFLECLDNAIFGNLGGTSLVTLGDAQTIFGTKTFTATQIFSVAPQMTFALSSILGTDGTGVVIGQTFGDIDPLTIKGEVLSHNGTDSTTVAVGADGQYLRADSAAPSGLAWKVADTQWKKFTIGFAAVALAGSSNTVTVYNLQVNETIEGVIIRPTVSFTGGTITAYTVQMGYGVLLNRMISEFDVFQAITGTVSKTSNVLEPPNFDSVTSIQLTTKSSGGLLNAATQGSIDIYLQISVLP